MPDSLIPQSPAGWFGYLLALATFIGAVLRDRRKADVDESAIVLGEWKKLIEAHQSQIKSLTDEVSALRGRLSQAEERIAALEEENRRLRIENDGLIRQQAQRSQSEVTVLAPNIGAKAPTAKQRFLSPDGADTHNKRGGA